MFVCFKWLNPPNQSCDLDVFDSPPSHTDTTGLLSGLWRVWCSVFSSSGVGAFDVRLGDPESIGGKYGEVSLNVHPRSQLDLVLLELVIREHYSFGGVQGHVLRVLLSAGRSSFKGRATNPGVSDKIDAIDEVLFGRTPGPSRRIVRLFL